MVDDVGPASDVERVEAAYLATFSGDSRAALRAVIADALADLCERERRLTEACQVIARGYVRGELPRLDA